MGYEVLHRWNREYMNSRRSDLVLVTAICLAASVCIALDINGAWIVAMALLLGLSVWFRLRS